MFNTIKTRHRYNSHHEWALHCCGWDAQGNLFISICNDKSSLTKNDTELSSVNRFLKCHNFYKNLHFIRL